MATRSYIGLETEDGIAQAVYCHWDGYPEYNGKMLLKHYSTREKVKELIALGSLSSLGEKVAPDEGDTTHSFETPTKGVTIAYHRDRGEEYCSPMALSYLNIKEIEDLMVDYVYIFTLEGEWIFAHRGIEYKDLTKEVTNQN